MDNRLHKIALRASILAGAEIMHVYNENEQIIDKKADDSPLTKADLNSNAKIIEILEETGIPVISEEIKNSDYEERGGWKRCWIIDPMDGTKEFVNRNGEFTVNIALLDEGKLVFGVIYAPVLNTLYYTSIDMNFSLKAPVKWNEEVNIEQIENTAIKMSTKKDPFLLKVVASKSHLNKETEDFIASLAEKDSRKLEKVSVGSSLKFCLVAEGSAEVYPRFGPTMEWDTAAGQAICEAAGLTVTSLINGLPLQYNKEDLYNPFFIVK